MAEPLLPPPPPDLPPNAPFGSAAPFGAPSPVGLPAPFGAPPAVPSAEPPAPRRSLLWLWVVLAVVAVAGVGAAIVLGMRSDDDEAKPAPDLTVSGDTLESSGNGWAMTVPTDWEESDFAPQAEAAWYTGGGTATFGSNVNIGTETPGFDLDLRTYMQASERQFDNFDTSSEILGNDVFAGEQGDYGRLEYTAKFNGLTLHGVAYVIKSGDTFIIATFIAPPERFATEAPQVEPFLATLRPA